MSTDLELYFEYRCWKGLSSRSLDGKPEYEERLKYEIGAITSAGFCGYLLVVADFVGWARSHSVPTGPGRGSAVGSLCCYCLKITQLDPVRYGLIFERFINPHRISNPDIDLDFGEAERIQVIDYARQKYGEECVAHIGTYGTLKAKAAIRAAANLLGAPHSTGDRLAKLALDPIEGKPVALADSYQQVPELGRLRLDEGLEEHKILIAAEHLEDRIRSFGTHAAGIVISNEPVKYKIPLYRGKNEVPTTQFDMNIVEECGLIKFDFLGLRTLTTISKCCKLVKERHKIDIDVMNIQKEDMAVFNNLQKGDVVGVFQLENSSGFKDLLVRVKPTCLEDLAALLALYRPGPLQSGALDDYLLVRAGEAEPRYLVPQLKPILSETNAMLIYQEQVLEICKQLAGYTMGEADVVRKGIAKKHQEIIDKEKPKFIDGCVKNKIKKVNAEKIWADIEHHAAYSFCKSHAVSYSYITYITAYLKTHYTVEYLCACLTSDSDEQDKVIKYIGEGNRLGIQILPPDINKSYVGFTVDGDNIRFGLSAIKNIGVGAAEDIIQKREEGGNFKDITDFSGRVDLSKFNRAKMSSLILAGAFDWTGHNRASLSQLAEDIYTRKELLKSYESKLITYNKKINKFYDRETALGLWEGLDKEDRQLLIKNGRKRPSKLKMPVKPTEPAIPEVREKIELPQIDLLSKEKELIGYYVSGHPLDLVSIKSPNSIEKILERAQNNQRIVVLAIPSVINEITTKTKKKMAYVVLEDKTATIQSVALPRVYSLTSKNINTSTPALYTATVEILEKEVDGDLIRITKLKIEDVEPIQIKVPVEHTIRVKLNNLPDLQDLKRYREVIVEGERFVATIRH